jgi:5-formyltetrahydrofolate cyclo-ligase
MLLMNMQSFNIKQQLRIDMKKMRNEIDAQVRQIATQQATKHLHDLITTLQLYSCGIYHPIQSEISPLPLIEGLNIQWFLPYIDVDDNMNFAPFNAGDDLKFGKYGIMEPSTHAPISPQAVITPLLAVDEAGNRLGYGKGYYDKFFTANPQAIKIGFGFAFQFCSALPYDAHDIKLDYFVSESGIYSSTKGSKVPSAMVEV